MPPRSLAILLLLSKTVAKTESNCLAPTVDLARPPDRDALLSDCISAIRYPFSYLNARSSQLCRSLKDKERISANVHPENARVSDSYWSKRFSYSLVL